WITFEDYQVCWLSRANGARSVAEAPGGIRRQRRQDGVEVQPGTGHEPELLARVEVIHVTDVCTEEHFPAGRTNLAQLVRAGSLVVVGDVARSAMTFEFPAPRFLCGGQRGLALKHTGDQSRAEFSSGGRRVCQDVDAVFDG